MYYTIKRIYKKSYNSETKEYDVSILDKAIAKGWITEEDKENIIQEVKDEEEI